MATLSSSSGDDGGSPSCSLRPGATINEGDGARESFGGVSDGRGATFLFVQPVPEDYMCHICLTAAVDAQVTEQCGHLFCRECIERAMEEKAECPVDRLPLSHGQIRRDIRAQRKIQSLKVYCGHRDGGCPWIGDLSDGPSHLRGCAFRVMRCPYEEHGCDEVVTASGFERHLSQAAGAHSVLLARALGALKLDCDRLRQTCAAQQRLLLLSLDGEHFLWALPAFHKRRGVEVSKVFKAKGLSWYMKVDFDEGAPYSAVYLYASAHTKRVAFEFLLFNVDPTRDERLHIADWHEDFKGKGWGNKRFIDRLALADAGFVINDTVVIGVHIVSNPY